ncbi:hypothetical protein SUDANB58_02614 [Streptomyces sp. enrichment culture]
MQGALKPMGFQDAPPPVHCEGVGTGRLEDDPATVARQRFGCELLVASALPREKSPALIETPARDHAHEEQP